MSKYINADEFISYIRKKTTPSGAEWTAQRVREMPAADVVEVVRCKDCKYQHKCHWANDDGFCSYGERKETE